MAKLDTSTAPAPTPSLVGASLPKLGAIAALGSSLFLPACASTRPPIGSTHSVAPMLTPAEVVERQAVQRGREELSQAQGVARSLGISNFVYVASNGHDFTNFSQADSLQGPTDNFQKSTVRLRDNGHRIEFTVEAFERWKDQQVASVFQQRLSGVIIDFDGRVWLPSNPSRPIANVSPFLVLRDQK